MIQQIKPGIRPKTIRQISKAAFSILVGACCLLAAHDTYAQAALASNVQQQKQTPLKSFLGYYQLPDKVAFLVFEEQDNTLYATQLWDQKKRYQLLRNDDTHFKSKNEGYTVEFLKDGSGNFSQTKILDRILCQRVPFDPSKVVSLSTSQLKQFAGIYLMANDSNFKIKIEPLSKGLSLTQLWDNKTISFTPRSQLFFLNDDGTFPLTFSFANGKVERMHCFENDLWLKDNQ
jgi:hypothetical protein